MHELYLLRHAKAAPNEDGIADRDRPLVERGRKGAETIAKWIKRHQLSPDLVLCSPAARARETFDLVRGAVAGRPEIRYEPALYLADAGGLLAQLRQIPESVDSVMLVGHNPGLHELAMLLSDTQAGALPGRLATGLPTAALVRFEVGGDWGGLIRRGARLVALVTPKELAD